jgi:hypothetical protein
MMRERPLQMVQQMVASLAQTEMSPRLKKLIEQCLKVDQLQRPKMAQVEWELKTMHAEMPPVPHASDRGSVS